MLLSRLSALTVVILLVGCSRVDPPTQPDPVLPAADSASANTALAEMTAAVDEAIRSYMAGNNLPGAAVVIVRDGQTLFKRGYGLANVEQSRAVNPDQTVFRIGSISKALTLLALTRLVDDGRLSYDDDVSKYFEGIENPHRFEQPVTISDLMTHTTGFDQIGIGRHYNDPRVDVAERKDARPTLVEFLQNGNLRRVSPPGQYFRYDTYGTTLAGAVLERVTGLPYDEAMQREMFEPLGMTRSSVEVDPEFSGDLALGYGFVNGDYVPQTYEVYFTTPASSIDGTIADMGRLLEALTGGGANEHGRLLSSEAAAAVLAPQFRPHPDFLGTTHGLHESNSRRILPDREPIRLIGHGGDMLGFKADMTLVPELNVGIFAITNRNGEAGGGHVDIGTPVRTAVIETLYQGPPSEPYKVPKADPSQDLSDYTGDYHYGVFCHSCTDEEFTRGGWPASNPRPVVQSEGALMIGDQEFLPVGDDVFVQSDGSRKVFFGRDEAGKVSFYVYSTSVDTFERIDG